MWSLRSYFHRSHETVWSADPGSLTWLGKLIRELTYDRYWAEDEREADTARVYQNWHLLMRYTAAFTVLLIGGSYVLPYAFTQLSPMPRIIAAQMQYPGQGMLGGSQPKGKLGFGDKPVLPGDRMVKMPVDTDVSLPKVCSCRPVAPKPGPTRAIMPPVVRPQPSGSVPANPGPISTPKPTKPAPTTSVPAPSDPEPSADPEEVPTTDPVPTVPVPVDPDPTTPIDLGPLANPGSGGNGAGEGVDETPTPAEVPLIETEVSLP